MMTQAPTTGSEDTVILEEMFVQIARNVTSDESTLTLQDVSPSTLYFSDRPERVVGHMTTEQFVDHWSEGPNSFLEDSPNAVMSYVGTGDEVCDRGDHTMTVNSRRWASRSRNSRPNLAEPRPPGSGRRP